MVAPGRWEEFANRLLPRWLRGTWMDRLWTALLHGPIELLDQDKIEAAKVGLVQHGPDDAVDYYARERQLERIEAGAGETTEALRTRAAAAWDFWTGVSTTTGLRDAIRLYTGLAGLEVYDCNEQGDDWLGGDAALADGEDDNYDNWSRHFIVIPASSHSWTRPTVGPGLVVGPGLMVGLTMTQEELSRIRRAYRRHRPSHMVGGDIYVLFDGTTAAAVLSAHDASADFSRLPLHRQMVGYQPHGMTVGPSMIVGYEFT
jgi:hypothetical protein